MNKVFQFSDGIVTFGCTYEDGFAIFLQKTAFHYCPAGTLISKLKQDIQIFFEQTSVKSRENSSDNPPPPKIKEINNQTKKNPS